MCKVNYILYKHISEKFDSVPGFAEVSGIPQRELNAVLLKEYIVREIHLGLAMFRFLNLDVEKLLTDGIISETGSERSGSGRFICIDEFRSLYMRLSEAEKKRVTEFMASLKG